MKTSPASLLRAMALFAFGAGLLISLASAQIAPGPVAGVGGAPGGGGRGGGGGGARRGGPADIVGSARSLNSVMYHESSPGELVIRDGDGKITGLCPLQHTSVEANIAGFVARVHVKQLFHNPSNVPVEATYTFPLPDDAAVDEMTMRTGDRVISAEIKKREEARQIYTAAKNAGQNAALLDQEHPNIFTQTVANLMPGQDITIEISYVNLLKYEDGHYDWMFPTVVGPHYTGGESAGPDPAKITPPITPEGTRAGHDISITVNLDAGMPLGTITSLQHPIDIGKDGPNRATVTLRDLDTLPNKDFTLRYTLAGGEVQGGLIASPPTETDDGYFTLILQPPAVPATQDIAPKEMIFILDKSGSQQGDPLAKAKETVTYALQHLNPNDTFQLITFDLSFYPCFDGPVANTPENVQRAIDWMQPIVGNSGTDILKCIDYLTKLPTDPERPVIVSYLTDGLVGNAKEVIEHISTKPNNMRFFPFGVGNGGVDHYLIDGMAREGRGAAEYVGLNDSGAALAEKFYQRIAQPLLLDINVNWGDLAVSDVFPRHIPDVFSSTPIVLTGRYQKGGQRAAITVSGLLRGQPWSQRVTLTLPDSPTKTAEALPSLWARQKIDDIEMTSWKQHLTSTPNNVRTNTGSTPEMVAQVTDLALKYHLLSDYTSFVAVEERLVNIGGVERHVAVPVEMPDGVSYQGIEGANRQTYTGPAGRGAMAGGSGGRGGAAPMAGAGFGGAGGGGGGGRGAGGSRGGGGGGGGAGAIGGGFGGGGGPAGGVPPGAGAPRGASAAGAGRAATPSLTLNGSNNSQLAQAPGDANTFTASGLNSDILDGTAAGQRRLDALSPAQSKALLRQVKLAPGFQTLPELFISDGKNGTLNKPGIPTVTQGRVETEIWVNSLPADGLEKLKTLGFDLVSTLTPDHLLLGTIPVDKLDELIALNFVRRVEPPSYQ